MAAQRRRADDVEDCEYDADDVGERERERKKIFALHHREVDGA